MASTPPAESSSGRNHLPYDVFISHCGQDTKHTVANSIYMKLTATGLTVFLDKDELQPGDLFSEVLENAIASASLHIAIFSQNFAKSPWCLAELTFMLKTCINFIPIYYHVEPSTLRNLTGIYADAFNNNYEKKGRYSTEMLQNWKQALHEASLYPGEVINNQNDEEAVAMNVVSAILRKLKRVRLDVARHPVGLDKADQDFDNFALQSTEPIKVVGILGMGGLGKTTLAKHLYNKKCSLFQKSSFLFDIREAAHRGRLHETREKLLHDLTGASANFHNMEKGITILRNRLRSVNVLIVLDDVDHIDQLNALLPPKDSLGHGSLIIVTTRDLNVLKAWNISHIYKMGTLNHSYAMELFCWTAFGQSSPVIEFKELAERFIDAACGLPLSLKVLGGLLYGQRRKEYWQFQLNKLSRMVPEDIKSRLKISYDALDYEEKEMFLDVACFFIGWPSSSAIAVWDGSEWSGLHGWQRLVNRCLVELSVDNKIMMNDHLRDLGREIANKQSPYRLWSKRQIIEIQPQKEAIRIRGMAYAFGDNCYLRHGKIILNTSEGQRILEHASLGLKIFIGQGDFINEECSELFRELVCFAYDRFAHKKIPSWLPLTKLRILQLGEAYELEDLWERDEDAPLKLRQLGIGKGYRLKNTSGLQRLTSLETLRIQYCTELKTLVTPAEATSLEEIDLQYCDTLEKIEGLEGLRSLKILRIYDCRELNTLTRLEEATSLKMFDLKGCNKIEKIEGLKGLRSLETLIINDCTELNTLTSFAELTSLKKIDLKGCDKLEKIESLEGLRSLETLRIYECTELKTLPNLAQSTFLKMFDLIRCKKLEKIESLEGLRSLETLRIYDCTELNTLPSLAELTSLKEICLKHCNKLENIESLEGLRSLEILEIHDCTELNTTPRLGKATSLKMFDLKGCNKVEKIESLEGLRSLKTLTIYDSTELKTLPTLAELTSLEKIDLKGCIKLETLRIYDCIKLNTLPSLGKETSLKMLDLRGCNKLEKIESLQGLKSLETLIIYECTELKTLPSLAEATSLKMFDLRGCNKLEEIKSLEGLRSLETLIIYFCTELKTLPSLAEATSLKKFDLRRCKKLGKIESLKGLRSLETLRIYECTELKNLPSLAEATSLKKFDLIRCNKLEKIESLEGLSLLETLRIYECTELKTIPSLAEATSLKKID